jgi:dienelactone hydrolase
MKSLVSIIIVASLALALGACTPPKAALKTSAGVLGEIEPHLRIRKPAGTGPFPTVLILHGASDYAWYSHFENVTERLAEAGFASVFIDSYSGRGLSGQSVRGGSLLPAERASDLLVTLNWLKGQTWARADRVGALGYSHGAATIMDALVLDATPARPAGLTDASPGALNSLKAAVLFYPYCTSDVMGFEITRAYNEDWKMPVNILAFIPGSDQISDAALCSNIMKRHKDKGLPVTFIDMPGVGHSYDQVVNDHNDPQPEHDAQATDRSYRRALSFLASQLN